MATDNGKSHGGPAGDGRSALTILFRRLKELLDDEQSALKGHSLPDYERLVERKIHVASDLSRLAKQLGCHLNDSDVRGDLRGIGLLLEKNSRMLKQNIRSAEAIVGLICEAIARAVGDGTYSSNMFRRNA